MTDLHRQCTAACLMEGKRDLLFSSAVQIVMAGWSRPATQPEEHDHEP
jgi:hypothetical protein